MLSCRQLWPVVPQWDPNAPSTHILLPLEDSAAGGSSNKSGGPLLPELAQLQWLEEFVVQYLKGWPPGHAIPAAWGQPGAFPRLKR